MNTIDDFIALIRQKSQDRAIDALINHLQEWKTDQRTVSELHDSMERLFGNIWIEKNEDHERIYRLWNSFLMNKLELLGSMTINERLYVFGLMDIYDLENQNERRTKILNKIEN